MDVTPLIKQGTKIIQSYANGGFKISGEMIEGGVLVNPEIAIPWPVSYNVKSLKIDDFVPVFEQMSGVEIILLGTGKATTFITPDLRKALKDKGVSIDIMTSDAACRTYNVLIAEGRRVAACLFPHQ